MPRRSLLALAACALACAKQPAPIAAEPEPDAPAAVIVELAPEREPEAVIDDERQAARCRAAAQCPTLAQLAGGGAVYLGREDEALAGTDKTSGGRVMLASPPANESERVEVVCASESYWISYFIEQRDLQPVIVEPVHAVATADAIGSGAREGLYLREGVSVKLGERRDDVSEIFVLGYPLTGASGWVPSSVIGRTYAERDTFAWDLPTQDRVRDILIDVAVRDTPNGDVITTLGGSIEYVKLGSKRSGQVLIAAGWSIGEASHVIGWVDPKTLVAPRIPGGVPGGVVGGVIGAENRTVDVPAGSRLAIDGRTVGEVLEPQELRCVDRCDTTAPVVSLWCHAKLELAVMLP